MVRLSVVLYFACTVSAWHVTDKYKGKAVQTGYNFCDIANQLGPPNNRPGDGLTGPIKQPIYGEHPPVLDDGTVPGAERDLQPPSTKPSPSPTPGPGASTPRVDPDTPVRSLPKKEAKNDGTSSPPTKIEVSGTSHKSLPPIKVEISGTSHRAKAPTVTDQQPASASSGGSAGRGSTVHDDVPSSVSGNSTVHEDGPRPAGQSTNQTSGMVTKGCKSKPGNLKTSGLPATHSGSPAKARENDHNSHRDHFHKSHRHKNKTETAVPQFERVAPHGQAGATHIPPPRKQCKKKLRTKEVLVPDIKASSSSDSQPPVVRPVKDPVGVASGSRTEDIVHAPVYDAQPESSNGSPEARPIAPTPSTPATTHKKNRAPASPPGTSAPLMAEPTEPRIPAVPELETPKLRNITVSKHHGNHKNSTKDGFKHHGHQGHKGNAKADNSTTLPPPPEIAGTSAAPVLNHPKHGVNEKNRHKGHSLNNTTRHSSQQKPVLEDRPKHELQTQLFNATISGDLLRPGFKDPVLGDQPRHEVKGDHGHHNTTSLSSVGKVGSNGSGRKGTKSGTSQHSEPADPSSKDSKKDPPIRRHAKFFAA